MTHIIDDIIQNAFMTIDKYIFSKLTIEWKHNYEWKKHPALPSKENCEKYGIEYGVEQPGGFELVLYDNGQRVYSAGCFLFGPYFKQESVDRTYDRFFEVMRNYQEYHKYFSLFAWYLQKKTHIILYNEIVK